jgi:hypothetical protein
VSKRLSDRAVAIKYRHRKDGQYYEHTFRPGVRVGLLDDGSVKLTSAEGRRLWRDFPDRLDKSGAPIEYLVNAPDGARPRSRKTTTQGSRSDMRHRRRHSRRNSPRRSYARKHSRRSAAVVRYEVNPTHRRHGRRRHAVAVMANPHRSHRRHYRRNPPMMAQVKAAAVASVVNMGARVVQKKTAGLALGFVPTPTTATNAGMVQAGIHTLTAAALIVLGAKILPRHADVIAGAVGGEALEQWAMLTPAAPYLSAYVPRNMLALVPSAAAPRPVARKLAGYVQAAPTMGAYARGRGNPMPVAATT